MVTSNALRGSGVAGMCGQASGRTTFICAIQTEKEEKRVDDPRPFLTHVMSKKRKKVSDQLYAYWSLIKRLTCAHHEHTVTVFPHFFIVPTPQ